MSKQKFDDAKAYIQVKEYDKARRILKTIDHPTAKTWLEKLDKIAPEKRVRRVQTCLIMTFLVAASVVCAVLLAYVLVISPVKEATRAQWGGFLVTIEAPE